MEIIKAILLGVVQGITEFLPVSSSGHLLLVEDVTGISQDSLLLGLFLHLGTLVSVCIVLKNNIINLFRPPRTKLVYLVVATIPAGLLGMLLDEFISELFSDGKILPWTFLLTSVLLFLSQKIKTPAKKLTIKHSFSMGIGQGLALLPGLSRSGSTIAFGLLFGGDKEEVAEFSFLMSIPIILGGAMVQFYKLLKCSEPITSGIIPLIVGTLTSCVVGFIVVRKMLDVVKRGNFKIFSIYLSILSLICFVNYYLLPIW